MDNVQSVQRVSVALEASGLARELTAQLAQVEHERQQLAALLDHKILDVTAQFDLHAQKLINHELRLRNKLVKVEKALTESVIERAQVHVDQAASAWFWPVQQVAAVLLLLFILAALTWRRTRKLGGGALPR